MKDVNQIVLMDINDIHPYANNPRFNDEAMHSVANSIKEFGFQQPIIVDKNNVVIAGHTRLKAAKYLNLKKVPVIVAKDLSDEQVKAYRIADNSTSELARWDIDLLNLELEDIKYDMADFGLFTDENEGLAEKASGDKLDEKEIKKMELRAFEHYDYLVFVFDNQQDFLNACTNFNIQKVDGGYVNRKLGIGRVVKGDKLIERLGDKDSNPKS